MKLSRRKVPLRLQFEREESAVLTALLDDLLAQLDEGEPTDAALRRLYPPGHDDPQLAEDFRELTQSGLREDRSQRARDCRTELAADAPVELTAEAADRWIRVLNDLRLVLGTRLGVTEDAPDAPGGEAGDSDRAARNLYDWLTYVQGSIVERLMR